MPSTIDRVPLAASMATPLMDTGSADTPHDLSPSVHDRHPNGVSSSGSKERRVDLPERPKRRHFLDSTGTRQNRTEAIHNKDRASRTPPDTQVHPAREDRSSRRDELWSAKELDDVIQVLGRMTVAQFDAFVGKCHQEAVDRNLMTVIKRVGGKELPVVDQATLGTPFLNFKGKEFKLRRKLGHGNTGDVFEVTSGEELYAIKLVRFSESMTATRRSIVRLLQEVKFHYYLAKTDVKRNTKVPLYTSLAFPAHCQFPYLGAVQPLGGFPLDKVLSSSKGYGLSLSSIQRITLLIVQALDALHSLGITHGDLKPGNILINCEPKLKRTIGRHPSTMEQSVIMIDCVDGRRTHFKSRMYRQHLSHWSKASSAYSSTYEDDACPVGNKVLHIHSDTDFDIDLIDLGASVFTNRYKLGQRICGSFHLKPPEDLVGIAVAKEVFKRDIWALGLLLFQLWTGHPYQPAKHKINLLPYVARLTGQRERLKEAATRLLGPDAPPIGSAQIRKDAELFLNGGEKKVNQCTMRLEHYFPADGSFAEGDTMLLHDFIRKCLVIRPLERPSARQLLKHPFIESLTERV